MRKNQLHRKQARRKNALARLLAFCNATWPNKTWPKAKLQEKAILESKLGV